MGEGVCFVAAVADTVWELGTGFVGVWCAAFCVKEYISMGELTALFAGYEKWATQTISFYDSVNHTSICISKLSTTQLIWGMDGLYLFLSEAGVDSTGRRMVVR